MSYKNSRTTDSFSEISQFRIIITPPPAQADGLALDGDGVHILADAQDSRKCGVFGAELDVVIEQKHALEGGFFPCWAVLCPLRTR